MFGVFNFRFNSHNFKNGVKLSDSKKLGIVRRLEMEGKALFRDAKYDEAMKKFNEANNPKYYLYENHGNGYAEAYIRRIYFIRGEYEKALENINKILGLDYIQKMLEVENEVGAHRLSYEKMEYEALMRAQTSNSNESIYAHIGFLKKKYKDHLPPLGYTFGIGTSIIPTILGLYDTIADYDAGIAYIDEIMEYFKQKDIEKYGEYKPGKVDREYLKVREGFEQDKAEGRRPCLGRSVCVGRASQALIQSDYFPW